MELQEKEEVKDKNHVGKMSRENPKIRVPINSRLKTF